MKLNNFEVKNNFWEVNSNFLILPEFKLVYSEDKSKGKDKSSKIMWALSLLLHPDSTLFNISFGDRKRIIASEFFSDADFDWKTLEKEIAAYQKLILSAAQRQLLMWNRFMDEKIEYMTTLKYDKTNWEEIEKMLKSNKSLYDELARLQEDLDKEGAAGSIQGGAEESASEQGLI